MDHLLTAIKNRVTRLGSTLLFSIVFLTTWIFRKITRRQAGISFNTALVLLLAAILLLPFAMNFTAHLLARN